VAVLVVAGSGREAGKTAVGCALIAAMPEFRWVAAKISPHLHGVGEELWEEPNSRSEKDTGRYLGAGARRSFLIRGVSDSRTAELIGEARSAAQECDALVVESNRIAAQVVAKCGEPSCSIAVVVGTESEWKASLRECIGSVDALVLVGGVSPEEFESTFLRKPIFTMTAGQWSMPELVGFVRDRLLLANS